MPVSTPGRGSAAAGVAAPPAPLLSLGAVNTRMAGCALRAAARWTAWRRLQMSAEGLENIPRSGPVVLAVRHYHHLYDGVVLLALLPRRLHVLVALDWVDSRPLRRLMEWATRTARWPAVLRSEAFRADASGRIPHPRSAFAADEIEPFRLRAVRDSVALLCEGAALAVFPEGYPNVDPSYTPKVAPDEFLRFRTGFAVVTGIAESCLGRQIPIVPVGFTYRPGRRWQVHLRCGSPLFGSSDHAHTAGLVESRVRSLSTPRSAGGPAAQ